MIAIVSHCTYFLLLGMKVRCKLQLVNTLKPKTENKGISYKPCPFGSVLRKFALDFQKCKKNYNWWSDFVLRKIGLDFIR